MFKRRREAFIFLFMHVFLRNRSVFMFKKRYANNIGMNSLLEQLQVFEFSVLETTVHCFTDIVVHQHEDKNS